ncbi:hypothetical protein BKA56DRAFT_459944, partial [Ilyonectria sp. MPI-CAGE-AT-0026]
LAIRYVTSAFLIKKLEPDVVLITISWLMALANLLSVLFCIPHGWGQHAWNVTIQDATKLDRAAGHFLPINSILITDVWCPVLTRLVILSVLYRIDPSKWFRISAYAIAFAVVVYSVTFTVLLGGPCNPIDAGANNCLINLGLAQVLLSIFSDVAVIILPIPTLWKLQMPFRKKMLTGGILTLGSGVLLATIARAPYMKLLVSSTDFTQTMAEIGVVSALELNLGIVCNNLIRMKPFISRYFPNLFIKLGLS